MIYLVRHGEAAASWGEHPDPGLSDKGGIEAEAAAKRLIALDISNAITSPMARCRETSEPYAELSKLDISIVPEVTEIPTPEDIGDRREWLRGLMAGTWDEAPDMVRVWRENLLNTITKLPEKTVVFSHFIAINAIVGEISGSPSVTVFRPNYCSITSLRNSGGKLSLIERGESLDTRVL